MLLKVVRQAKLKLNTWLLVSIFQVDKTSMQHTYINFLNDESHLSVYMYLNRTSNTIMSITLFKFLQNKNKNF